MALESLIGAKQLKFDSNMATAINSVFSKNLKQEVCEPIYKLGSLQGKRLFRCTNHIGQLLYNGVFMTEGEDYDVIFNREYILIKASIDDSDVITNLYIG